MTKIQQNVKENYKGNEKGLLNKKAIEAVFAILHRKSSKSKLKKTFRKFANPSVPFPFCVFKGSAEVPLHLRFK